MTKKNSNKLNSIIILNSDVHTRTDDKTIKNSFNENNVVGIKNKQNSNKDRITIACTIGANVMFLFQRWLVSQYCKAFFQF